MKLETLDAIPKTPRATRSPYADLLKNFADGEAHVARLVPEDGEAEDAQKVGGKVRRAVASLSLPIRVKVTGGVVYLEKEAAPPAE